MGYVSAPKWASPDFKKKDYDYELKFAFENELNNRFSLGYNIGTSENFKNLKLTMGLDYSATENLSTYIEYYSTLNKIKNIHNLDVGLLYLFTPWFQVDIACGSPVIGDKFNFYTTFGISYLFK